MKNQALRLSLLALALLAFLLRVYHLAGQSLWYDEGFSVFLARQGLAAITAQTAADIQPPLYYYLLHAWLLVAGQSEFAVRFLSAVCGVLAAPLAYQLGRRLLGGRAALVGALLLAVSPFYVWYGQETRMYTLVTLLVMLSSWLLVRGLQEGEQRWGWWALYALANVAAVYSHYYAFFVVAAQGLYTLGWLVAGWRQSPRPHPPAPSPNTGGRGEINRRYSAAPPPSNAMKETPFPPNLGGRAGMGGSVAQTLQAALWALLAQLTVLLSYLPWAGFALRRYAVDESYWEGALSPDFVRKTLLTFATGQTVFEAQAQLLTFGFLAMLALGIALLWPRRTRPGLLFLLLWLIVPFILLYALSAYRPKFHPRYLMIASPPFFLLLAAAVQGLWQQRTVWWRATRAVAAAGLAFVLAVSGYALANNYSNRVLARDDFRSVAAHIGRDIRPGEAIVLVSGHLYPVFQYYYPAGDIYRIPDQPTLSTKAIVTYAVADRLNEIAAGHSGLWLVLWQNDVVDPNNIITGLLDTQAKRLPQEQGFWGIELRHYRFAPGVRFSEPAIATPARVNFGGRLLLLGHTLDGAPAISGQAVNLTLFWQALQEMDEDYVVAVSLLDPRNMVYGVLNQRPAGYSYPTTRWQPGPVIPGRAEVAIAPGAPPGEYRLQVSVFAPEKGTGLDILDANNAPAGRTAIIGSVRVAQAATPPTLASLQIRRPQPTDMGGGIALLGSNTVDTTVRPGDVIPFDLFWRAERAPSVDYRLQLRVLDTGGAVFKEETVPFTNQPYPTSAWPAGAIVRGSYALALPPVAASPLILQARVLGADGAPIGESPTLATYTVAAMARTTAVPPMRYSQRVLVGDVGELLGYDLSATEAQPGQAVELTLYWRARSSTVPTSYTVFTHLLSHEERVFGQHDGAPAAGARPTSSWQQGEVIADRHSITVRPDAPAGAYRLEVGLYDPVTNRRLPVTDATGTAAGDRVLLGASIRISP